MVKKIVISYFNDVAAILQNSRIEEIVVINDTYQVNDIYIGVVHKVFASIDAAFVNLGRHGKSGFIHINDAKSIKRHKQPVRISDILSINQLVLVQVVKEPTLHKGPRLTTNIHLHGKYVILMPFCNVIVISHKVYDSNERLYLHSLAALIKPQSMGLLVKASAQGASDFIIVRDLDILLRQWLFIQKATSVISYPCLVYRDEDIVKKLIRDVYDKSIKKVVIDSYLGFKLAYYYLKKWSCFSSNSQLKLQLYRKQNCILDRFRIKQTIKAVLKPKVKLSYGGYIIIQNYEALTIVDVNSGSFNSLDSSRETILRINLYAAIEISYQLRLRNINGVIIIDFIDMLFHADQLKLLEHFNRLLIMDNSKPRLVQLSQLGLLELTRRRRSQSLKEIFSRRRLFHSVPLKLCYIYDNNFSLSISISYTNMRSMYLVNQKIKSLFFGKNFCNLHRLGNKYFSPCNFLHRKYFECMDRDYTVSFFNPRANYLLPLVLYIRLTKDCHIICETINVFN